jgi:hypothetical protein
MKIRSRGSWETGAVKLPFRLCVTLALLLLTAGCGQASAAGLGGTVKYAKSGGIAGISESMTIGSDGRGRIEKRSFRLTASENAKLAAMLRKADVAHVKSPKGARCCDHFHYSIRYRGHEVRWDDGSGSVPRPVSDLAALLARLHEKYAR